MRRLETVDYSGFRFRKLKTPEFRHLLYLLYWPLFGLLFVILERVWIRERYFPVSCPLDEYIPFCEAFLFPYLFWFAFLLFPIVYGLLFDIEAFTGFMKFIVVSYSAALLVYILFPNCQQLRPETFARDNLLTRFMAGFYRYDTNTNVCPSLHVIGSVATACCAWRSKRFSTRGWRAAFAGTAALISLSTVFLKQHSVVDLLAAIPVCFLAYGVAYRVRPRARQPEQMLLRQ